MEPSTPAYFQSHYMPNTPAQRRNMLDSIGIKSIEELFNDIPEAHRNPTLKIPPPMPTTPEINPKIPPIKIEKTNGIFL